MQNINQFFFLFSQIICNIIIIGSELFNSLVLTSISCQLLDTDPDHLFYSVHLSVDILFSDIERFLRIIIQTLKFIEYRSHAISIIGIYFVNIYVVKALFDEIFHRINKNREYIVHKNLLTEE